MAQRKTLLIVDDDTDLRGALAEQLQAEDFAAVEAADGREGVRQAQDAGPTSSCWTSTCRT
jgi:DNA-binding response OmpR family regulator